MDNKDARVILLSPPLTEPTSKARRNLLAISCVGVAVIKTGLIPTQFSSLGIQFSSHDQESILLGISLVTIYFLVTFSIKGASDFTRWIMTLSKSLEIQRHEARIRILKDDMGVADTSQLYNFQGASRDQKDDVRMLADHLARDLEERIEKRTSPYGKLSLPLGIVSAFLEFVFLIFVFDIFSMAAAFI